MHASRSIGARIGIGRVATSKARWCSAKGTKGREEWPKEVPMVGGEMKMWMDQTGFDLSNFFNGVFQAYGAVAHIIKNGKGTGDGRWKNLPVDEAAKKTIVEQQNQRHPFNDVVLALRIAHPNDHLFTMSVESYTLKEDGEELAKVRIVVSPDPHAIFGNDVESVQKFITGTDDEEVKKTLAVRFLETLYCCYFESNWVHSKSKMDVLKDWNEFKETGFTIRVNVFWKWLLERQPKPRRLKEWVFRKNIHGEWSLHDLPVICARI